MHYKEEMELLSSCGIGEVLLSPENLILEVNAEGDRLLMGNGELVGKSLNSIAPELCEEKDKGKYARISFNQYVKLLKKTGREPYALPPCTRLVRFYNGTKECYHDMMRDIINHSKDNIALFDREGCLCSINDAGIRMEHNVPEDIIGKPVEEIYTAVEKTRLTVPQIIETKKAMTNYRQYYTTPGGVTLDIVTDSYPIVQNGQLLGVCCLMQDMSTADTLHKQLVDLQEKMLEMAGKKKRPSKSNMSARYKFKDIVHTGEKISKLIEQSRRIAKNDSNVLIYGETGTGKELFAQSIHNASKRADEPFLAINCAAIPNTLLESMLFGTEKGAYTGAEKRPGFFELADGGTLMLDEMNSMDIQLQSKLLRVLQEGVVCRVGGTEEIRVDVRVISAINEEPLKAVEDGKMRLDLYYRLGVVNIHIPPLRERTEDIPLLTKRFIMTCNEKMGRTVRNVNREVLHIFTNYDWPGNVRELQHCIEHAMNILPEDVVLIIPEYLPEQLAKRQNLPVSDINVEEKTEDTKNEVSLTVANKSLNAIKQDVEREAICRVLLECDGNITQAAHILKMSRQNLQYRIRRYRINVKALVSAQ